MSDKSPDKETPDKELELDLNGVIAQGHYANLAVIAHSETEFVLDFAAVMPGVEKPKVFSRIILAPEHAKRLLLSLEDNITRYETAVGRIDLRQAMPRLTDEALMMSFVQGEA